jgi:osmotically-inducible protein OsmY
MTTITVKSDAEIQRQVLDELKWDPRVDATEVGVQVKNGVVTLTGTISSYAKKFAAGEAAHKVQGVLDVANDLVVELVATGKRSDADIARAVRNALQWDAFVPDESITSTVSDGWVTLGGTVSTWSEREDAARAVRNLIGVRGVSNEITVKARKADPTQLRKSIEDALARQAEREARRIEIQVRDGVATLTGPVRSWSERRAVIDAAGFAPGVSRVEDKLRIDTYS